jgi:hypothetical protein
MNVSDRLLDAIADCETGHLPEWERDSAIGDGGLAVGRYQIQPIALRCVNRFMRGRAFTLADRTDPAKSRDLCALYLTHWLARVPAERRTPEAAARIWNGGPDGWRKAATDGYAARFIGIWGGVV